MSSNPATYTPDAGLAALTAAPHLFYLPDGSALEIRPLKVRQIQPFARAVSAVLPAVRVVGGQLDLLPLVTEHGQDIAQAVAVAVEKAPDWVGALDADTFVRLAGAVLEVNADFFVRRLVPTLTQQTQTLAATLATLTGSA